MLAGMQVVRPDVTANDAADRALMKAWQVAGPPTLLLIGPDGQEHRAERTVGEITPEAFLRSEEHTSELQSLMRISYAVFCLKKKIEKLHERWLINSLAKLMIYTK